MSCFLELVTLVICALMYSGVKENARKVDC